MIRNATIEDLSKYIENRNQRIEELEEEIERLEKENEELNSSSCILEQIKNLIQKNERKEN